MVQKLVTQLPPGYVAEPRVHLGTFYEIDVCAFDEGEESDSGRTLHHAENGSVVTQTWAPPAPTLTTEMDIPEEYAYEVLVFDDLEPEHERELVAAIEIALRTRIGLGAGRFLSANVQVCCKKEFAFQ
jgi:hypothetical protein